MAKLFDFSPDQQVTWDEWVASRPPVVQALCKRFPPNHLYRLTTSGHRVTIYSFNENDTVTVNITGDYNLIGFSRQVFGINPDDLVECELPAPGEPRGEILTTEAEVLEVINKVRENNGLEPLEELPKRAE